MPALRSCDRCYKIKARCEYSPATNACQRCLRLDHKCETRRAVLPSGRPKSNGSSKGSPPSEVLQSDSIALSSHISVSPFKGFSEYEISLVAYALHPDQIASIIYGKSSQIDMRKQLFTQLTFDADLFKDAILAFATAISDNKLVTFNNLANDSDTARASRALIRLTDLNASSVDDAENALGLALLLITFNDLKIGSPTLPISRAALLRASPWQHQLLKQPYGSKLICLMFIEIFECIAMGSVPIFRYESPANWAFLDTYYGICHYLLPSLYDVCVLYERIKSESISTNVVLVETHHIHTSVSSWDPIHVYKDLELEAGTDIREHSILQAEAFKLTIQVLLLQACRSSANNDRAKKHAADLSHNILQARLLGHARPKYLLFPYFVACLELYEGRDGECLLIQETMNDISNYMAPKAVASMVFLLQYIWRRWQRRPDLTWFQVIQAGIPVAMGP